MPGFTLNYSPSIRSRLSVIVLACILPYCVLALLYIKRDYGLANEDLIRSAMASARTSAIEVDKEFAPIESALLALSTSPDFRLSRLQALEAQARKLVALQKTFNVLLEDSSGQQLINTFMPFGTVLPREPASRSLEYLRTQNTTFISSQFIGAVSKRRLVAVGIPSTTIDGDWVALTANFTVDHFAGILRQQHYPEYSVVSIVDRGGRVVARSAETERFAGKKVELEVLNRIQQQSEAIFEINSKAGVRTLMVTSRAEKSGWTVVIEISLEQIMLDLRYKVLSLALATTGLLGIGLLFAWKTGARVSKSMHDLIASALALGRGQLIERKSYGLLEAEQVGNALARASTMLQQAQHEATHDVLTAIANRAMFYSHLERQLAVSLREMGEFSVIYLDLDHFKPINDTHGHAVGDQLLIEAAARLTSLLRKSDLAARLGGDEFAVVMTGGASEVTVVKEKLSTLLAQPYMITGIEVSAPASIGVAIFPHDGRDLKALLEAADHAMYRAKNLRKRLVPQ